LRRSLFPRLVGVGLLAVAGLTLASLVHRSVYIDDAWLGERAWWLAREGVVRSELFGDVLDYGERMFVFHKLFALSGAVFIGLFGWSLYTLKAVSLVSFAGFLALLWPYCRRFEARGVFAVTTLILLAHGLVARHVFIYRPEIMLMAIGFGSFALLRSFLEDGRRGALLGGAVLAGLCVLTHLNGLTFIAAGVFLLLVRRGPRPAVMFGLVASAVGALYLADAALVGKVPTLWRQLLTDPMLVQRFPDAGSRLTGLLSEHQRYFHSRAEIAFSVLVVVVLAVTGRATELRKSPLVPFALALAGSLAVLAPDKQAYYAIPILPYLALLTAEGLVLGMPRVGRASRGVALTVFWVYVANGAVHLGRIIANNEDAATRNHALASHIDPGATVVATLPFIFDEIENRTVLGLESYWVKSAYGRHPIPPDELFADARRRGARYIIMSREDLKFSGWPKGSPAASGPHHHRLYEDAGYVILELGPGSSHSEDLPPGVGDEESASPESPGPADSSGPGQGR
jgi:hypothetical protein